MKTYSYACIETYHDFTSWGFVGFASSTDILHSCPRKDISFSIIISCRKQILLSISLEKRRKKLMRLKASALVSRLFEVKLLLSSKEALVWEDHSFGYSSSSHHWRQIYRFSRNLPCLQQRKDGSGGGRKGWRPKDQMILFVYVCPTLPKGIFDLE